MDSFRALNAMFDKWAEATSPLDRCLFGLSIRQCTPFLLENRQGYLQCRTSSVGISISSWYRLGSGRTLHPRGLELCMSRNLIKISFHLPMRPACQTVTAASGRPFDGVLSNLSGHVRAPERLPCLVDSSTRMSPASTNLIRTDERST